MSITDEMIGHIKEGFYIQLLKHFAWWEIYTTSDINLIAILESIITIFIEHHKPIHNEPWLLDI